MPRKGQADDIIRNKHMFTDREKKTLLELFQRHQAHILTCKMHIYSLRQHYPPLWSVRCAAPVAVKGSVSLSFNTPPWKESQQFHTHCGCSSCLSQTHTQELWLYLQPCFKIKFLASSWQNIGLLLTLSDIKIIPKKTLNSYMLSCIFDLSILWQPNVWIW